MNERLPHGCLPGWLWCRIYAHAGPDPPADMPPAERRDRETDARRERARLERAARLYLATGRWG